MGKKMPKKTDSQEGLLGLTCRASVRLFYDEREYLGRVSQEAGKSVSQYLRDMIDFDRKKYYSEKVKEDSRLASKRRGAKAKKTRR